MSGSLIRPVERPETIINAGTGLSRWSQRNTNLPINTMTTKLLHCCSWNTKCAVLLRRHRPSAGHNKPSGGNRE